MTDLAAVAQDLRRSAELADPVRLCRALGLEGKRSGGGLMISCPAHGDRTPSCSVTVGPDGTVRCRCFACDWSADALGMVRQVCGCKSFSETIDQACDIAGCERPSDSERHVWAPPAAADVVSRPGPTYPWSSDVARFWGSCGPVTGHRLASAMLERRAIDPVATEARGLAKVALASTDHPDWARYRGDAAEARRWVDTGHSLILPVYDHVAEMRSVRAWRIVDGEDAPKRLPPAGCKATGLVLANSLARKLLRGELGPTRIVFAEGEPDFMVHATRFDGPVIGVMSGSWTDEFAERIPVGSTLLVRTDRDDAGDRYAAHIAKTCSGRCHIRRAAA